MAIDLNEISADPTDREGIIGAQNRANLQYAGFLASQVQDVQETRRLSDEISTDLMLQKAIHEQETALLVTEVQAQFEPHLSATEERILDTTQRHNQLMQNLHDVDQQRRADGLSWSQRRKLDRDYNEINREVEATKQFVYHAADDYARLQSAATVRTTSLLEAREVQFQAKLDEDQLRNSIELNQKLERLQINQEFSAQIVSAVNNLRAMSAEELAAQTSDDAANNVFRFMKGIRDGDFAVDLSQSDRDQFSAYYSALSPEDRGDFMELMMIAERARTQGVELSPKDFTSLVLRHGNIRQAQHVANLSGDQDLGNMLEVSITEQVNSAIEAAELDYKTAILAEQSIPVSPDSLKTVPIPPQEAAMFRAQAEESVRGMAPSRVLASGMRFINAEMSEVANNLGTTVYPTTPEGIAELVPQGKYSAAAHEALQSPEIIDVFSHMRGHPIAGPLAGTQERFVDRMEALTGNRVEAINIMTDINASSAERAYRKAQPARAAVMDTLKMHGIDSRAGKFMLQLPLSARANASDPARASRSYDGTNPEDFAAYLEYLRFLASPSPSILERAGQRSFERPVFHIPTGR